MSGISTNFIRSKKQHVDPAFKRPCLTIQFSNRGGLRYDYLCKCGAHLTLKENNMYVLMACESWVCPDCEYEFVVHRQY